MRLADSAVCMELDLELLSEDSFDVMDAWKREKDRGDALLVEWSFVTIVEEQHERLYVRLVCANAMMRCVGQVIGYSHCGSLATG